MSVLENERSISEREPEKAAGVGWLVFKMYTLLLMSQLKISSEPDVLIVLP